MFWEPFIKSNTQSWVIWKLAHVLFSTYLFLCVWLSPFQRWKEGFTKLSVVWVSKLQAPLKSLPGTTWIHLISFLYLKNPSVALFLFLSLDIKNKHRVMSLYVKIDTGDV